MLRSSSTVQRGNEGDSIAVGHCRLQLAAAERQEGWQLGGSSQLTAAVEAGCPGKPVGQHASSPMSIPAVGQGFG